MLLRMPVADLEVCRLFTRRVPVAVGVTPDAQHVLTGSIVVGLRIPPAPMPIVSAYASASRRLRLSSLLVIDLPPFIAAAAADWAMVSFPSNK